MANKKKKAVKKAAPIKAKAKTKVKAKAKPKVQAKAKVSKPVKKAAKKMSKPAPKKVAPQKPQAAKKSQPVDYTKAFTPLADRLVVRVAQAEKITAGGIIIPATVSTVEGHLKGEVLAVGSGAKNKKGNVRPLDVQLGDFVLFNDYAATKIEFNSEELHIVKEVDVMGIVQE